MRILITGALGHIGSRLIRNLPFAFPVSEIVMVDAMLTQRYCSLFSLPKEGRYRFIEADITAIELEPLFADASVVVHLAAMTDAAGSIGRAEQVELNNFAATVKVAEACVRVGVPLITLSSTSVYGTQGAVVDEECSEDALKPQSPYAATKLKEERFIEQLVKDKGLKAGIYRFGTIFGVSQGMRFHTAVNKFCWQAAMGQPITVWSTAYDQKRPYLDLSDACRAIEHIIREDLFDGRIYNVLTRNYTVRDIVQQIQQFLPDIMVQFVDHQIMNQLSYEVDDQRFRTTGFVPRGSLEQSIHDELLLLNTRIGESPSVSGAETERR